jgi:pimeloyl-ACP methyl ester carboxylesterase
VGGAAGRRSPWRVAGIAGLVILILATLAYVVGFFAYGFFSGADEYLAGTPKAVGCATPGSRFGWAYEAINYDIADDARLIADNPDLEHCSSQGAAAGDDLVAPDGVRLAGWYIPSANEHDWKQPIVVLVHGGKSNKSGMLDYAPPFHDDYDVVILDLRNSGRSGDARSTGGLHEQHDIGALLDWLSEHRTPLSVVLVGNSNGAAAALAEANTDHRVQAMILDSMHASVERQIGNVIVTERNLPAWPGAWGLVAGVSYRLGEPLESVDPARQLGSWDGRVIMFTHGSADVVDRPGDSLEVNLAVADATGITYEVNVCQGAGHGQVVTVCRDQWASWVREFMAQPAVTPNLPD